MRALLVFDSASFSPHLFRKGIERVDLFPLTADWEEILSVVSGLREMGHEPELLPSAEMVDGEASRTRERFIEWAAAIGNIKIGGKALRQWLLLPDGGISAWWFGLLADKDPAKSRVFLRIIQTGAILKALEERKSDTVVLALKDGRFQKRLRDILEGRGIGCRLIAVRTGGGVAARVRDRLGGLRVASALYHFGKIAKDLLYLKRRLPPLKSRRREFDDTLLFFAYFPSVVKEEAERGRFRNRNAIPLQDLCRENGKQIAWILTYAGYDGYSFRDAVDLAARFISHGEEAFFYQEFLTPGALLKAFQGYLRTVSAWRRARRGLRPGVFAEICGNGYAGPFLLDTMDESFRGFHAVNGAVQYEAFKNLFRSLKGFSHVLYYCEMMGWEYALNAAKRGCGVASPAIGYQHSAISLNYLHMFHSREELKEQNTPAGIPMPEVLAGNGPSARGMLERYYGRLDVLEAVRYLYINDYLRQVKESAEERGGGRFVLLVCTNIELKESLTLARLVKASFPEGEEGVEIWFKGHPALPVRKIFEEAGLDEGKYAVKEGAVSEFLAVSDAVLVGASTVAVEALAFGCEVLVYINAETLNQSPLIGFEEYYHKVYDPAGMRRTVNGLRSGAGKTDPGEKRSFVKEFWNLNPSLEGWRRVFELS